VTETKCLTRRLLAETEPFFLACDRIRRGAKAFHTNLFAPRERLEDWSARGLLSWTDGGECLLIFRTDRSLQRVYHVAQTSEAIGNALLSLHHAGGLGGDLVSDLVGVPMDIAPIAVMYASAGFQDHSTLVRMTRISDPVSRGYADQGCSFPDVDLAGPDDVGALEGFLLQLLDRFVDQIPEPEELKLAIARDNILIVRHGDGIGGMLDFTRSGLTATLRYWYVNPLLSDRGIGGRLMKNFLEICRDTKRIVLWVSSDNLPSIAKYRHYGFQMKCLTDRIMTRRRASGK